MTEFASLGRDEARISLGIPEECKYILLSYGGSLGAEKINEAMLSFMKNVVSSHPEIYHIHATGSSSYEKIKKEFDEAGLDKCPNIDLREYIYNMPLLMSASDVVVCRAGAMTVSELSRSGKCAVFVPSPNVTNNHQYKNAKVLADDGAALLFEEPYLADGELKKTLLHLLSSDGDEERASMEERIAKFSVPDANKRIFEDVMKLVSKK